MGVADLHLTRVSWSARFREPAVRGAQLLAVSGFALAQPLFDILGKNAEFFAARASTPGDILLFALVVTFVPALGLLLVELGVGAVSRPAGYVLHLVFLAFFGALFGVHALKRAGLSGTTVLIAGAVLIGLAVVLAVWRASAARWFLTVLAAAPVVFVAVFLFGTPVQHLVFPNADARAAAAYVRHPTPVVFLLFEPRGLVRHHSSATSERLGHFERGVLFERNALQTALKNFEDARDAGASVLFAYDTSLLEERTVAAMASDYIGTLEAAVSTPDRPLDGLVTVRGAALGVGRREDPGQGDDGQRHRPHGPAATHRRDTSPLRRASSLLRARPASAPADWFQNCRLRQCRAAA